LAWISKGVRNITVDDIPEQKTKKRVENSSLPMKSFMQTKTGVMV